MSQQKYCIWVVDDHSQNLTLLKMRCVAYNSERVVVAYANGQEAWDVLKNAQKQPLDLLLTDTDMPKMNGNQLIVNAKIKFPELSAVLISGQLDNENLAAFTKVEFLPKPYSVVKLHEILNRYDPLNKK